MSEELFKNMGIADFPKLKESITQYLKPKSTEEIKKLLVGKDPNDIVSMIIKNKMENIFTDEELKKLIWKTSAMSGYIFGYKHLFTNDEIKAKVKELSNNEVGLVRLQMMIDASYELKMQNNKLLNFIKNSPLAHLDEGRKLLKEIGAIEQ